VANERRRTRDNIKIDVKYIGVEAVDWKKLCEILVSHGGEDVDVGLRGCEAVWICR
jgi:hypothetical protein